MGRKDGFVVETGTVKDTSDLYNQPPQIVFPDAQCHKMSLEYSDVNNRVV